MVCAGAGLMRGAYRRTAFLNGQFSCLLCFQSLACSSRKIRGPSVLSNKQCLLSKVAADHLRNLVSRRPPHGIPHSMST